MALKCDVILIEQYDHLDLCIVDETKEYGVTPLAVQDITEKVISDACQKIDPTKTKQFYLGVSEEHCHWFVRKLPKTESENMAERLIRKSLPENQQDGAIFWQQQDSIDGMTLYFICTFDIQHLPKSMQPIIKKSTMIPRAIAYINPEDLNHSGRLLDMDVTNHVIAGRGCLYGVFSEQQWEAQTQLTYELTELGISLHEEILWQREMKKVLPIAIDFHEAKHLKISSGRLQFWHKLVAVYFILAILTGTMVVKARYLERK